MSPAIRAAVAACLLSTLVEASHAGRSCEAKPITILALQQGLGLAERTASALDASGARVVVLARAGQDLSRYGLRWSHLGLAYRTGAGWRIVHKLNECGTSHASLYRQGLGEFFLDDPHRHEAAYVVLAPELGSRVLDALADNRSIERLNNPAYSMVAHTWATTYQQSNQWAIETLASLLEPDASTRQRAQAWLQLKGYRSGTLRIDAFTRLGARMTRANVAFDDHPAAKRFSDRIETVTVDSVFDWMSRSGLGGTVRTVH